jgi:hypothetical protein
MPPKREVLQEGQKAGGSDMRTGGLTKAGVGDIVILIWL